jgi:hypothetical protein
LANAINELTHYTCKLRTSLWCALQIMLNLNENSNHNIQQNDLFCKLNDDFNDNLASQMKILQLNDDSNIETKLSYADHLQLVDGNNELKLKGSSSMLI